ncbi:MAG: zinc ribbon domain-containing protein [Gemmatimonadetes bacterium]|nr:zinc ribbon domain-containing protein [Gemmatimonadota bacterium]NNK49026.1 zinc ribbon domain-containing protein [Gemmatimonadota bacterium]
MPTYEYECRDCGHAFERFQGINEDPATECPECGGKVRRLISSGGGLVFKGPGFYATDYRSAASGGGKQPKEQSGDGASGNSGKDGAESGG